MESLCWTKASIILESAGKCKELKVGGWILINSPKDPAEFANLTGCLVATVEHHSEIGRGHKLGSSTTPMRQHSNG